MLCSVGMGSHGCRTAPLMAPRVSPSIPCAPPHPHCHPTAISWGRSSHSANGSEGTKPPRRPDPISCNLLRAHQQRPPGNGTINRSVTSWCRDGVNYRPCINLFLEENIHSFKLCISFTITDLQLKTITNFQRSLSTTLHNSLEAETRFQ